MTTDRAEMLLLVRLLRTLHEIEWAKDHKTLARHVKEAHALLDGVHKSAARRIVKP